jgi:hypothetical protein
MHELIKKIHMYTGLLNFTILVVFGIAGLQATFQAGPERRPKRTPEVRFLEFTASPRMSDPELAEHVYQALQIPLAAPVPKFAIRRDPENRLALNFYTVNGIERATVLENENRVRIETTRNSIWQYFNSLHTTTMQARAPDLRIRLWGYYNELAIWSLIGMAASGVYLWLSSRPRFRPAQYTFATGAGIFLLLYILTR